MVKVPRGYSPLRRIAQDFSLSPVMDDFCSIYATPRRYIVFCLIVCYASASHSLLAVIYTPPFCLSTSRLLQERRRFAWFVFDKVFLFVLTLLYVRFFPLSVKSP